VAVLLRHVSFTPDKGHWAAHHKTAPLLSGGLAIRRCGGLPLGRVTAERLPVLRLMANSNAATPLKHLPDLDWRFPANVIAALLKLGDCRTFELCKFFKHFLTSRAAIFRHGK